MDYKELGFYGVLLQLISTPLAVIFPVVGFLALAGGIMLILAYYYMSKSLNRPEIWRYFLYYLGLGFLAGILFVSGVGIAYLEIFKWGVSKAGWLVFLVILTLIFVIASIVSLVFSAKYYKMALFEAGEATGMEEFKTAGKWLFWGIILSVVLVGTFISFIGNIFLLIAFHNLRKQGATQT